MNSSHHQNDLKRICNLPEPSGLGNIILQWAFSVLDHSGQMIAAAMLRTFVALVEYQLRRGDLLLMLCNQNHERRVRLALAEVLDLSNKIEHASKEEAIVLMQGVFGENLIAIKAWGYWLGESRLDLLEVRNSTTRDMTSAEAVGVGLP